MVLDHGFNKEQKVFWEKKDGTKFDDISFTIDKHTQLDCQYGMNYFKDKESKYANLLQRDQARGAMIFLHVLNR